MNDEHTEPTTRDEWLDRLVERGLREAAGGEAPPDLSERIRVAAAANGVIVPSTLEAANMDVVQISAMRRRKLAYATIAALACGVAALVVAPLRINSPQLAPQAALDVRARAAKKAPANTGAATTDIPAPMQDDLMMAVTPHIIIEGREEERLGVADHSSTAAADELSTSTRRVFSRHIQQPEMTAELAKAPAPADVRFSYYGVDNHRYFDKFRTLPTKQLAWKDGRGERLAELKRELASLDEQVALASQQASGPVATERIVKEAMDRDPMIADYRKQLDAIDQEIVNRQEIERRNSSPMIARLQQSRARVAEMEAEYRGATERQLRENVVRSDAQAIANSTDFSRLRTRLQQKIAELEQGQGPDLGGDQYARINDNPFKAISAGSADNRLSTFSIDVDTAAYANVRQFLMDSRSLPPADAVRIEELVNYFDYDYAPPTAGGDEAKNDAEDDKKQAPFAAHVEVAACPWNDAHRLVRIGLKGREMDRRARPQSNLVFLVDVSGSMNEPNKLPLVVEGLRMLAGELGENDRVAIVVYASSEGLALPSTPGSNREKILAVLDSLEAGGSTAGGAGIKLAYQLAQDNFVKNGTNRVILCTDGDFNVGVTSPAELQRLAETKAKETGVFLTVLGFGRGNLNDAMMEQVADHGNGAYHYVDNRAEARKVLVEELTGTLVTIAKDVKIQVEFNPAVAAGYRLIGYENRVLAAEDFNDDTKDAGEIGAGHAVTALYEVIPAGAKVEASPTDELKYSPPASEASARGEAAEDAAARSGDHEKSQRELLTLKIRFKQPDGDTSAKQEFAVTDKGASFAAASPDFQFAAAVASFGMLLRDSPYKGMSSFGAVAEIAESASRDRDPHGYRKEFIAMVRRAAELTPPPSTP